MADIDKLVEMVSAILFDSKEIPNSERLNNIVTQMALVLKLQNNDDDYSKDDIEQVIRIIQTRHDTSMGLGVLFDSDTYKPWLADKKDSINFYYWNRYKKLLAGRISADVVLKTDEITDKILDHLEDPTKEGAWERRGLVVGNVQSGKTANYIGVMNKAADAGYKVIVILGGLLNSLRNQTQMRIDSDFLGFCTKTTKKTGVAKYGDERRPISLTTAKEDFKRATATQVWMDLNSLTEPVLFVIKKNVTTLKNLRNWLAAGNQHGLSKYPLLLIDDEADHASINTNKADKDPTKINQGIRQLLKMFPRNAYVGYTATPFANIFIDPENENEMIDGEMYKDLFPRDFILSLDPPSNYIGPNTFFNEKEDNHQIIAIDDNDVLLPVRHGKDFKPGLPPSLKEAIRCFILVKTIRELDGQKKKHHSMMINVSRFTAVQECLRTSVAMYFDSILEEIRSFAGLSEKEALQESSVLRELKTTWENQFSDFRSGFSGRSFSWIRVQHHLYSSASSIKVISINNESADRLDYSEYPNGRAVIVVGGLGLSRGLTLEGLSVSYFLRNSIMYDTLLQMGRWFGYREGYKDLCRIFMTTDAKSWYDHITSAVEELREEFREMDRSGLTPLEFGLKVRSHPTALIVTARNKMRDAQQFVCQIALEGRFVETSRLINKQTVIDDNARFFEKAVIAANKEKAPEKDSLGWLWRNVSIGVLEELIENFQNAPDCLLTYKNPLLEHISWLKNSKGVECCDILLRGFVSENSDYDLECDGLAIKCITRSLEEQNLEGKRLTFIKRHIISRGDEAAGLSEEEIERIRADYAERVRRENDSLPIGKKKRDENNVPDSEYRHFKSLKGYPPLLILVFAKVFPSRKEGKKRIRDEENSIIVPAYGISFPGMPSKSRRPEKLVSYTVNRVWQDENKEWFDESEEEEDDE